MRLLRSSSTLPWLRRRLPVHEGTVSARAQHRRRGPAPSAPPPGTHCCDSHRRAPSPSRLRLSCPGPSATPLRWSQELAAAGRVRTEVSGVGEAHPFGRSCVWVRLVRNGTATALMCNNFSNASRRLHPLPQRKAGSHPVRTVGMDGVDKLYRVEIIVVPRVLRPDRPRQFSGQALGAGDAAISGGGASLFHLARRSGAPHPCSYEGLAAGASWLNCVWPS